MQVYLKIIITKYLIVARTVKICFLRNGLAFFELDLLFSQPIIYLKIYTGRGEPDIPLSLSFLAYEVQFAEIDCNKGMDVNVD
jgi:hypothetical protein